MILLIDNYDSFVHNLARYIGRLGHARKVVRRGDITINGIRDLKPDAIIISPGPCAPGDSGISPAIVKKLGPEIPVLGICLGHQCIGAVYGGAIIKTPPRHGKHSPITHDGNAIFKDMPDPFTAGRYHSLGIDLPEGSELIITARTADDENLIMGVQHKTHPVYGLQFHPESILTEGGERLLGNFCDLADRWNRKKSAA